MLLPDPVRAFFDDNGQPDLNDGASSGFSLPDPGVNLDVSVDHAPDLPDLLKNETFDLHQPSLPDQNQDETLDLLMDLCEGKTQFKERMDTAELMDTLEMQRQLDLLDECPAWLKALEKKTPGHCLSGEPMQHELRSYAHAARCDSNDLPIYVRSHLGC